MWLTKFDQMLSHSEIDFACHSPHPYNFMAFIVMSLLSAPDIAVDREVAKCKSMPNASIKYTKWYIPTKEYVSHHIYNHFKVQTFRQTIIYFFTFVKCALLHTPLPLVSFSMSHINFWLCICIENALPGKPEKIWKIKDMDQNERLSVQNVDCLSGKQWITSFPVGKFKCKN